MTEREVLMLALEAFEQLWMGNRPNREKLGETILAIKEALAQEKALQALHDENERLGLYKDVYAQPEEEKLHPIHIGVDVTREGTAVTAFYRKPNAVMEMFYSQFHPMAQPEFTTTVKPSNHAGSDEKTIKKQPIHHHANLPLAQPEQEPVGFYSGRLNGHDLLSLVIQIPVGTNLYTTPPQPEQEPAYRCRPYSSVPNAKVSEPVDYYTTPPQRKPLTKEQRIQIVKDNTIQGYHGDYFDAWGIIDDVEAAHGIKGKA